MNLESLSKQVQPYLDAMDILSRACLVAIIMLVLAYYLQVVLLRPMRRDMRKFGRDVWRNAKQAYLSSAWLGWILVLFGIAVMEVSLIKPDLVACENCPYLGWLVGVGLLMLGVIENFRRFITVFIASLREKLQ